MGKMSFEQALKELEETVEQLEEGEIPLDESLKQFEKGVKLARFLREELDKAEKKIEILLKNEDGEIRAEPFDLGDQSDSLSDNLEVQDDEDQQ